MVTFGKLTAWKGIGGENSGSHLSVGNAADHEGKSYWSYQSYHSQLVIIAHSSRRVHIPARRCYTV